MDDSFMIRTSKRFFLALQKIGKNSGDSRKIDIQTRLNENKLKNLLIVFSAKHFQALPKFHDLGHPEREIN